MSRMPDYKTMMKYNQNSNIINIVSNWVGILVGIFAVFITYPILTHSLGEEQYGIWLYISSITGYFTLLQLGVPLANVKYVSEYNAKKEYDKVNEVLSSNIIFYLIISFAVILIGCILSWNIEKILNIPSEYLSQCKLALLIATINVTLSFILEIFQGILHALSRLLILNFVKVSFIILRVALLITFVENKNGLIVISTTIIIITVLQGGVFFIFSKKVFPKLKLSIKKYNFKTFSQTAKYSVFVMILQASTMLSFQTDAIVIGSIMSTASILVFSVSNSLFLYSTQMIVGVSQVLLPKIIKLYANGDRESIVDLYFRQSRLVNIIILPFSVTLFLFGGNFIGIWMGEKYWLDSTNIIRVLVISYSLFWVQRAVAFPILMGSSKMRFISLLMASSAILNLFLSVILGVKLGLVGIALGTTIPNFIISVAIIIYMKKEFDLKAYRYVKQVYLVPSLATLLYAAVALALSKFIDPKILLNMSVIIIAAGVFYLIVLKSFGEKLYYEALVRG